MKQGILAGLLLLLTACTVVPEHETAAQQQAYQQYQQQIAAIEADSAAADYQLLRESFSRTAYYLPYQPLEVDRAIELFEAQQYADCLSVVEAILARRYAHIQAHFMAMLCQQEQGNEQAARKHDRIVRGLLASIDASGDGSSVATALTTYDTQELYSYLEFMGLKPISQSLINDEGRWYDVMTVSYQDEAREFKLYFDITVQFMRGMLN